MSRPTDGPRVPVIVGVLALLAWMLVTVGGCDTRAEAATVTRAPACAPVEPERHPVIGGVVVDLALTAHRCGGTVRVSSLSVSSTRPVTVRSVEVYRYRYAGSRGAVQSAVRPGRVVGCGGGVWIGATIPAHAGGEVGWDGYVRVVVKIGGEARPIVLFI